MGATGADFSPLIAAHRFKCLTGDPIKHEWDPNSPKDHIFWPFSSLTLPSNLTMSLGYDFFPQAPLPPLLFYFILFGIWNSRWLVSGNTESRFFYPSNQWLSLHTPWFCYDLKLSQMRADGSLQILLTMIIREDPWDTMSREPTEHCGSYKAGVFFIIFL